jgi:hypothetical protein
MISCLISYLGISLNYQNQKKYGYEYSLYEYGCLSALSAPGVFLAYGIGVNHSENYDSKSLDVLACLFNGIIYAVIISFSIQVFKALKQK